jgi:hypothetical protein
MDQKHYDNNNICPLFRFSTLSRLTKEVYIYKKKWTRARGIPSVWLKRKDSKENTIYKSNHGNSMKSKKRKSLSYNEHNSHRHDHYLQSYKNQVYFCVLKIFL